MTVDLNSPKGGGPAAPTIRAQGVLAPLGHDSAQLDPSGLLGGWRRRTLETTIPYVLDHIEDGEALGNLERVLNGSEKPFVGMVFTDSDIYKTLEAVAWASPGLAPDDDRLQRAERLVELVALAQEADGYVNSWVQGSPEVARWSDPQWGHELYTAGHLFQAAVAAGRTGVLPGLLGIATRFADLLVATFGPESSPYLDGHPQVETALVELYRVTGTEAYLTLAGRQLDRRGHGWLGEDRFGSSYFQDAVPIRSAEAATGHAVRQVYLLTGAVDVAVETGDQELLDSAVRVWEELAASKTYVTGALGSRHRDEAIGDPHELPPDRAYAETCAAIAGFQLGWRLLLATGESRYADMMETVLYNAIPASTAISGDRFFYSNPLHLRTGHEGGHEDAPSQRLPWFSCACCPPNLARLLASVHDYLITTSPDGIQVQHPTTAQVTVARPDGEVRLDLRTGYPYAGRIELTVETETATEWEFALRIPSWCKDFELTIDGRPTSGTAEDGYLRIRRSWAGQVFVVLNLIMPVRRIAAHPRVDAVRGCVALARGPVVYAMEDADLPDDVVLEDVRLLAINGLRETANGAPELDLTVAVENPSTEALYTDLPSSPAIPPLSEPFAIGIGPYHRWANRTPGAMRVWIPACFREETS
jgi:DUF1680 family protein